MDVNLPVPVSIYFAAENQGHTEIVAQCFTQRAVVRDEGKTIEGLAAIKQWEAETKRKYQHTIEPLTSIQKDGKFIVTNRLTGNFRQPDRAGFCLYARGRQNRVAGDPLRNDLELGCVPRSRRMWI